LALWADSFFHDWLARGAVVRFNVRFPPIADISGNDHRAAVRKATAALSLALTASLAGNVYLYHRWSQKADEVPYYSNERPLIEKAIALFGSELPAPSKAQTERSMRGRFPIVTQLPDPRQSGHFLFCVTLKLREGWLGFEPVYCFNEQGKLVSRARI
jgi:hypothetical protein